MFNEDNTTKKNNNRHPNPKRLGICATGGVDT